MPKHLMGLDVGGGGGRCLIVNTVTGETCSVFRAWSLIPDPGAGGFAYRMDPHHLWQTLCELAHEALQRSGVRPGDVAGIATTSMRHTTVVIDRDGRVLLMSPNRDARAAAQGMQLAAERGEELHRITGHAPSPIFLAARLLWLKESDPQAFRCAAAAMSISDWVGWRMTGEKASEYAQAGESLLLDLKSRKWSAAILKSLDLPEKLLPPLKPAGSRLGKLTRQTAADLGLLPGIPVAVGGPDTQCGLLGSGVTASGMVGVIAGTTTPIQLVTNQPIFDPAMRLWTSLHVIPGLYVLESNAGQMGATLDWLARLMYADAPNPVARLAAEAGNSQPGAHGVHSTIGAAIFNAAAMQPPVDTLTFSSIIARRGEEGRADLARAALEGMAYAVRANIDQILDVSGATPDEVHVTGGISRSSLWTRLLCEALNRPVQVSATADATALGAAICAGAAAGIYKDLVSGAQALARSAHRRLPGPESTTYQSLYSGWMSLVSARRQADVTAAGQITETLMASLAGGEQPAVKPADIRPRIYISAEVDQAALQRLGNIGEVTYKPYRAEGMLLAGDDLARTLAGYQVFVTEVDIVDAEALLRLPDLRLIVVCRGNPVNIDIQACTFAGVPVTNTPTRNADAVADLTVGFMLMLARRLQPAVNFLRQPGGEAGDLGRMGQAHEAFLGMELWRKTIGLIGGGAIGRRVASRLLPFGARLLVYDPLLSDEQVACMGAIKVSLEGLLAESDLISLHAAVTAETRGMIDAAAFAKMKPGALLVNTARAALIDQQALLSALQSGKLGGFATDVFPVEPPAYDDPLLAFPQVIATPHMGGNTREVAAHQGEIIADELERMLSGSRPKYLLNPAVMDSFRWSGARQMDETRLRQRVASPGPGATDLDVAAQQGKPAATRLDSISAAAPQVAAPAEKVQYMDTNDTRQKMIAILQEFTTAIRLDKGMTDFAKGKNVIFLFTVRDLDRSFFLSFIDGKVDAGLHAPPREPDVKLKMAADILDGMFTGRVNATKAATSGKLSFSGDTGKAMAFMRIQKEMGRLYGEARQVVGDPGDLTKIGAAPVPPASPAAAVPAALATGAKDAYFATAPAAPKTGGVRDQILMVTNELYAKGMITATGGNVSARCDDNPNQVWITPSAIFKGDLRADMMVRIDLDGRILGETDYNASSERRVHCAIYRAMPEVSAVIHSHAEQATLMALTGTAFQPISADAAFFGDIPVVPFIMPGTDELGNAVAKAMQTNRIAVLMQNHGLVVAGSSLRKAADMTEIIESTAHKLLTCRMLGVKPALLPEETVKTLKEIGASIA
jgi:autoinducer 2 (AI-2) kinase